VLQGAPGSAWNCFYHWFGFYIYIYIYIFVTRLGLELFFACFSCDRASTNDFIAESACQGEDGVTEASRV